MNNYHNEIILYGNSIVVQGRIQLLSKVGVHIRHTITSRVGGHGPQGKN